MKTIYIEYLGRKLECQMHEDEDIIEYVFFRGRHVNMEYSANQLRELEGIAIDKYMNI